MVAVIDSSFDIGHGSFVLSSAGEKAAKLQREDLPQELQPYYVNSKILYAYDYYHKDGDVTVTAPDILFISHGTHVAGIVAANSLGDYSAGRFDGIAPEAQLLMMKVFHDDAATFPLQDDAAVVAAIDDAIRLGADIINLSIGDPGFSYLEEGALTTRVDVSAAITRAVEAGIPVFVAAGNENRLGLGDTLQTGLPRYDQPDSAIPAVPGQAYFATSVASKTSQIHFPTLQTEGEPVWYLDNSLYSVPAAPSITDRLGGGSHEAVYLGLGRRPGDSTVTPEADDYAGKDVAGKVAVLLRGDTNFTVKFQHAQEMGATGIVLLNSAGRTSFLASPPNLTDWENPGIPYICVDYEQGQQLLQFVEKNGRITFDERKAPLELGMSGFSSWGPDMDLRLTPAITGIGGNVYSCVPRANLDAPTTEADYEYSSGTSMAAPHLSGCAALVCQYLKENAASFGSPKGLEFVELVNLLLRSTATPLVNGESFVSPRQQGSGLVNLPAALNTDVVVYARQTIPENRYYKGTADTYAVSQVDLGEIAPAPKDGAQTVSFTFTAQNYANQSRTYDLSLAAFSEAPTAYSYGSEENPAVLWYSSGLSLPAGDVPIRFSGTGVKDGAVTIPAGKTRDITVSLTLPYGTNAEGYDLKTLMECSGGNGFFLEGYVSLAGRDGVPDVSLPWMGFYGDWDKGPVFDLTSYRSPEDKSGALPAYWGNGYPPSCLTWSNGTDTIVGGFPLLDSTAVTGSRPITVTLIDYAYNTTTATIDPWCFDDVPRGAWYETAANQLLERKLLLGVGGGRFDPAGILTADQWATVLSRLSGTAVSAGENGGAALTRTRCAQMLYALTQSGAMPENWAASTGLMLGGDGLTGESPISRAEGAVILSRYLALTNPL